MSHAKAQLRRIFLATLGLIMSACSTTGPRVRPPTPEVEVWLNETILTDSLARLGELLIAFPVPRPYRLDEDVIVGMEPIPNHSGEEGLPPDLSTMVTTIVRTVGSPILPKAAITYREREVSYGRALQTGPEPHLMIRGSVTEGERSRIKESTFDLDGLIEERDPDGKPGRDSVDFGGSFGRNEEAWTLAIDLHLVNRDGFVLEAVSHRVDVVRRGRSSSYGVYFRGSGLGFRARKLVAQSKSQALRIAAQQSVIVLLGRHFRVPYWKIVPGSVPDQKLVETYRRVLLGGEAPEDYRLLLYASGLDIALDRYTFSDAEWRAVAELKRSFNLPAETSDLDLALHLWLSAPLKDSRITQLRRQLRAEYIPSPPHQTSLGSDTLLGAISQLRPGQELVLPVYFDYDLSSLSEPAKDRVDLLVAALANASHLEDWWIELKGHSDDRGKRSRLQKLSEKRAERVRSYLEQEHSVPSDRIVSAGFGSTQPIHENATSEEEHSRNRRVEILLVAGKRPELGAPSESAPAVETESSDQAMLFPLEHWPLPQGLALSTSLSEATLSSVSARFSSGRLSTSFGYYSVPLSSDDSDLFSGMAFFFRSRTRDPEVSWVGFSCRAGAEARLSSALRQLFPQRQGDDSWESVVSWTDLDGYDLTIGLDQYCFKIEPAR